MVNIVMAVFVGGALGAMLREFTMMMVWGPSSQWPKAILLLPTAPV